ncbi:monocarboxylate transporter 2-like isoform X2 [Apostichopus japonicus]|uniref:monocarboxylate transporter 2-like isoform X2 n=1 Tax=Stichopus japonicus TaxID=307972 RepID=UPI003AB7F7B0
MATAVWQKKTMQTQAPFSLFLLHKVGSRPMCILGGILSGVGYIFCGFYMNHVWQVFFGFAISGIGLGFATLSSYLVLSSSFDNEVLPKVISFITLFDYLGVATIPLLLQYLVDQYGLSNALILFGAFVWNVILTGVAIRDPPEPKQCDHNRDVTVGQDDIEDIQISDHALSHPEGDGGKRTWLWDCYVEFVTLFRHKNLTILLLFETVGFYIFLSWALFLFSLGTSAGLPRDEAVLLSTFGGIGGCIGRVITLLLFKFYKVNAMISSFYPFLVTGVSLLSIVFASDFLVMATLVFISGLSQGLNSSAIFSMIPVTVCVDHYQTVVTLELVNIGLSMQFSGLFSGSIVDITGSAVSVYGFCAVLSFLMLPIALWWSCREEPVLECGWSRRAR